MKYLIFRSDRIGDFLISSPLIQSIKRNDKDHLIEVVCSSKNFHFVNNLNFVNKTHELKKNNFISKLNLFFKLKRNSYDVIIVSDKKNRSIILSFFLNSKIGSARRRLPDRPASRCLPASRSPAPRSSSGYAA